MNHLYEYAVIRFVPDVEREEFLNVGLIMMCKRRRWVKAEIRLPKELVTVFAPDWDVDALERQLSMFNGIAAGDSSFGPIASLEPEERFRWLTAVKSACIQTSRPHPGLTDDLDATFDRLVAAMVR